MDVGHNVGNPALVAIDEHGGPGDVGVVREQHADVSNAVAQAIAGTSQTGAVRDTVVSMDQRLAVDAGMHQCGGSFGLILLQLSILSIQSVLQRVAALGTFEDAVDQLLGQDVGTGHGAVVSESVSLHFEFLLIGMFYGLIAASLGQRSTHDMVGNGSLVRSHGVEDLLNGLLTVGVAGIGTLSRLLVGTARGKDGDKGSDGGLLIG